MSLKESDFSKIAKLLSKQLIGKNKPIEYEVLLDDFYHGNYKMPRVVAAARFRPTSEIRRKNRFGWGISHFLDEARVKAFAEAYERYVSGLIKIDAYKAAVDFSGEEWLDPNRFMPLHKSYHNKQGLQRFDPLKHWEWVKGKKYLSDEEIMIPIDLFIIHFLLLHVGAGSVIKPTPLVLLPISLKLWPLRKLFLSWWNVMPFVSPGMQNALLAHFLFRSFPALIKQGLTTGSIRDGM